MGTTQRYLMFVSYVGSGFGGSQIQILKEGNQTRETVQYVLENGLKCLYRLRGERPIRVTLASRTDKGVHALRAALHVDLPPLKNFFPKPEAIKSQLNSYFTNLRNVRVLEVYSVPDSFSVTTSVLDKTYLYRVGILRKGFYNKYAKSTVPIMEIERTHFFNVEWEFDLRKAKEATKLFEGENDFGGISGKPSKNTRPTVCNIMSFTVEEALPLVSFDLLSRRYNYYHFICTGDRFLYHMVRRMVSLSLGVGFNILNLNDIQKLFHEPVPSSWPKRGHQIVSGCGLYLMDVNIDLKKISELSEIDNLGLQKKTEDMPLVRKC